MKHKFLSLVIGSSLVLGAYANTNITIQDFNTGGGFGVGPRGTGNEDQETEPGTVQSQVWDMEAFAVSGTTLYIVGGYNMQAGQAGAGGSVVNGMLTPGDLFIKVGGSQPGNLPNNQGAGNFTNAADLYTYAVDLTQPVGATNSSATIYSLTAASVFNSVVYDQFNSNPWKYASGGTALTNSTSISYQSGLNDAAASAIAAGGGVTGGSHNVLTIDLSFLSVPVGTNVWFSYTMECGNDSLKGKYSGGFFQVPDAFSSALLISLGLSALTFFGIKRRQS